MGDLRRSRQALDDFDHLVGSESLASGEIQQLASSDEDGSPFRCPGHGHTSSSTELEQALTDNANALITALVRQKPSTPKGAYLRSITVSSTMGPGIKIDPAHFVSQAEEA